MSKTCSTFVTIAVSIAYATSAAAQTVSIRDGAGVQFSSDDKTAQLAGIYFNNYPRFIFRIEVAYAGLLSGVPVDVKYTISADAKAGEAGHDFKTSLIDRSKDGLKLIVSKPPARTSNISVKGTIKQATVNGISPAPTELSAIILREDGNIFSSWLLSQKSDFHMSKLENATFLPKPPLDFANSATSVASSAIVSLFRIKNNFELELCSELQPPAKASVAEPIDQGLLAKVAIGAQEHSLRKVATQNLTEQSILGKIALEDQDPSIRGVATRAIADQAVLARIALKDKEASVREVATRAIADQAVLAKIAVEDKEASVRRFATQEVTDERVLGKIAVHDEERRIREIATARLTDQELLARIAVEDKESSVRERATQKLSDQALLLTIARGDKAFEVRNAASKNLLSSVKTLEKVAEQGFGPAQARLAKLYFDGEEGFSKDRVAGLKWALIASAYSETGGKALAKDFTWLMQPGEIAQSKAMAAEFLKRHRKSQ